MKTKLYRKLLDAISDDIYDKVKLKRKVPLSFHFTWPDVIKSFKRHLILKHYSVHIWWREDIHRLASDFKKKHAKYSHRYYDADNVLRRIIETGRED